MILVINEQHKLFPEQEELLNNIWPEGYETVKVPKDGWKLSDCIAWAKRLSEKLLKEDHDIVFASPVPVVLGRVCSTVAEQDTYFNVEHSVFVFHNDKREKKELPDGKVISTVAETGWELVVVC